MGFVGVHVGDTLGGGHRSAGVEGTFHQTLVEVAGNRHVDAPAGEGRDRSFVENAGHDIERVAAGGGVGYDLSFHRGPDTIIETVLPLGRLVRIIVGLAVLVPGTAAFLRRDHVATAVPDRGSVIQAGLLRQADGGIGSPAAAGLAVVRPIGRMHGVGDPERCVSVAVVEDGVVARLLARARMRERVGRDLLLAVGRVVPVPLVSAAGIRSVSPAAAERRDRRDFVAAEVTRCRLAVIRRRENADAADDLLVLGPVPYRHECLIVIGGTGGQAGNLDGIIAGCRGNAFVVKDFVCQRALACSIPETDLRRCRAGAHPAECSGQGRP